MNKTVTMNNHLMLLDDALSFQKEEYSDYVQEDAFFEFFVAKELLKDEDLSTDEIESGITDGGDDGGIDSFFFFINDVLIQESNQLSTIQKGATFKLHIMQASRETGFKENKVVNLINTLDDLFDLTKSQKDLGKKYNNMICEKIKIFSDTYRKNVGKYPKLDIKIHYATRSIVEPHVKVIEQSKKLEIMIKEKFAECDTSISFLNATQLWLIVNTQPKRTFDLTVESPQLSTSLKDKVCLVNILDYKRFITNENGELRKNMFESNVRDFEGDVEVNKNIEKTLKENSNEDFWWLNNGITIICSNFRSAFNTLTIEDPQIVNGLQTSTQIFNYAKDFDSQDLKKHVLIRVINPENQDSRDKIIKATNSQTALVSAQLRATDEIQRDIEKFFVSKGMYYERRKNFYKNQGINRSLIINISELAQTVNAIFLQKPHESRAKPSTLVKDIKKYDEIFNTKYMFDIYFSMAKCIKIIEKFMKTEPARDFSKDLKWHFAMYAIAKKAGTITPKIEDIIKLNEINIEADFLLDCLKKVNEAINEIVNEKKSTFNTILKRVESTKAIISLLENGTFLA